MRTPSFAAPGPAPAKPPHFAASRGSLPLPDGAVVRAVGSHDASYLTAMERQSLEELNVDTSRGVPDNIADLIAQARGDDVDLEERVRQSLGPQEQRQDGDGLFVPTGEGVARAREIAIAAAAAAAADPGPRLAAPVETPKPGRRDDAVSPEAADAVKNDGPTHCKRCHHAVADAVDEPSRQDVLNYLPVLGGGRFYKRYELFGGRVVLEFRSLLTSEWDMVRAQLMHDVARGVITGELAYADRMYNYRMAASLSLAQVQGRTPLSVPPLADIPWSAGEDRPDEANVTAALWKWVRDQTLASETMMRTCASAFSEFIQTRETLDLRASSPNFWTGIE